MKKFNWHYFLFFKQACLAIFEFLSTVLWILRSIFKFMLLILMITVKIWTITRPHSDCKTCSKNSIKRQALSGKEGIKNRSNQLTKCRHSVESIPIINNNQSAATMINTQTQPMNDPKDKGALRNSGTKNQIRIRIAALERNMLALCHEVRNIQSVLKLRESDNDQLTMENKFLKLQLENQAKSFMLPNVNFNTVFDKTMRKHRDAREDIEALRKLQASEEHKDFMEVNIALHDQKQIQKDSEQLDKPLEKYCKTSEQRNISLKHITTLKNIETLEETTKVVEDNQNEEFPKECNGTAKEFNGARKRKETSEEDEEPLKDQEVALEQRKDDEVLAENSQRTDILTIVQLDEVPSTNSKNIGYTSSSAIVPNHVEIPSQLLAEFQTQNAQKCLLSSEHSAEKSKLLCNKKCNSNFLLDQQYTSTKKPIGLLGITENPNLDKNNINSSKCDIPIVRPMEKLPTFVNELCLSPQMQNECDTKKHQHQEMQNTKVISFKTFSASIKPLHETANPWKRNNQSKGIIHSATIEGLSKKIRALLNKLTPDNLERQLQQLKELNINNEEKLNIVVNSLFEKALMEQSYSETYADLCKHLSKKTVPCSSNNGKGINFAKAIIEKCQMEFKKYFQVELSGILNKEPRNSVKCGVNKIKLIGNLKFLGELCNKELIYWADIDDYIKTLLHEGDDDALNGLCILLTTIGKKVASGHQKDNQLSYQKKLDLYFQKITDIVNLGESSPRIRFLLQDLIALRQAGWVPRRKTIGPKSLKCIHEV